MLLRSFFDPNQKLDGYLHIQGAGEGCYSCHKYLPRSLFLYLQLLFDDTLLLGNDLPQSTLFFNQCHV